MERSREVFERSRPKALQTWNQNNPACCSKLLRSIAASHNVTIGSSIAVICFLVAISYLMIATFSLPRNLHAIFLDPVVENWICIPRNLEAIFPAICSLPRTLGPMFLDQVIEK